MSNQYQASDYFNTLESLSERDWMLKLIKQFPSGEAVNSIRVLALEEANSLNGDEQKNYLKGMIRDMEKVHSSELQQQEEKQQNVQVKTAQQRHQKPIKLSF